MPHFIVSNGNGIVMGETVICLITIYWKKYSISNARLFYDAVIPITVYNDIHLIQLLQLLILAQDFIKYLTSSLAFDYVFAIS